MTDLAAAVITLRPIEEGRLTHWSGVDVREWFLARVAEHDASLHHELRHGDSVRPFTASALMGLPRYGENRFTVRPERQYALRVTSLQTELTRLLVDTMLDTWAGQELMLAGAAFQIEQVSVTPDETIWGRWAGTTTDAELVQSNTLQMESLGRRITVRFDGPSVFKRQGGYYVPFPMPELVFGNLLTRWNAFSDVHLHPDTRRYAEECMMANRHRLQTQNVVLHMASGKTVVPAFTGSCRYVFRQGDRYWKGIAHSLAAYGFYAGIGAYTAMGLGRVRVEFE